MASRQMPGGNITSFKVDKTSGSAECQYKANGKMVLAVSPSFPGNRAITGTA
jgi:hypothetical protein